MLLKARLLLIEVPFLFVYRVLTVRKLFLLFFDDRFSISPALKVIFASFLDSIYIGQQALYETDHLGRVVVVSLIHSVKQRSRIELSSLNLLV
jgi:hypothetical protein